MLCHTATRSPTSLLVALLTFFALAAATCYRPDGSAVDDNTYWPLGDGAEFSACCRASATYDTDHGDDDDNNDEYGGGARAPPGLCGAPGTQKLWRGSCTDPTWSSPACLNLCVDGDYAAADEVEVTTCDNGSFCCGADNSDCCARGDGVFVVDSEIIPPPAPPAPPSPPSPPPLRKQEANPSPPTIAARSPPIAKRGLSREAVTGLAVAGAFGVVGALTVAVYAASKWKRSSAAGAAAASAALPSGALPSHHAVSMPSAAFAPHRAAAPLYYHSTPLWGSTFGRTELDAGPGRPQELPGCPAGAELEGRGKGYDGGW